MLDDAFAPYRLAPGALPEETARVAEALAADPLVAPTAEPLPAPLVNRALADLPAGRAASASEACRAADGAPSGLSGPPRACLSSERQRARVGDLARGALEAGFAGVCLDRPDAPLALGLLGAGFCSDCQRSLSRHLEREYGDHFQPIDYLALARDAVAQSSGAVGYAQLPFGRDFWRHRHEALVRAVRDYARAARDAARATARPFQVVAQLEAIGPAQLQAARLLDAAIFPATFPPGGNGIGLARLLRAAMGRRPVAIAPADRAQTPAQLAQLAAVVATCGVEVSGLEPAGEAGADVASVRRLVRQLAQRANRAPATGEPVAECVVLYSPEADLWTNGRHRQAVKRAGEALAHLHVQAPVVMALADVPPATPVVLADASALAPAEAKELSRRLEAGARVLAFGEPGAVDEAGRPTGAFLPAAKPGGTKVGVGILAQLPSLAPAKGSPEPPDPVLLEKALVAILGKGRRAAGVAGRTPVMVVLHRHGDTVDAHLVALGAQKAQGVTLFLGLQVAGGVRRARFVSADGSDLRIPMNPSGYSISTVLPSFRGYAVLTLGA